MTPLAYNYLQNIINAMPSTTQAVAPSTTIGPCPIKVEICKDGVRAIETQILNDTQLNAEEKVILLMSASVARHSYAYWTMVWKDTNDAWWGLSSFKETPCPECVTGRDVMGLVFGGLVGGVRGLIHTLNPGGAATGAIIGGIGGAMRASIGGILDEMF